MIPSQVLGSGAQSLLVQSIVGTSATGLVSVGGTQATALQLPASQNHFSGASGAGGAKLPPWEAGGEIWLRNDSGNIITVYPFEVAGAIAPAAASFAVATGKTAVFKGGTSLVWLPFLSA